MKTTAVLWFCLFGFGLSLQQGFGQCAPTFYYRDADGDGYGAATSDEVSDAYAAYYADENDGAPVLHTNVYVGCNPPSGWVTTQYGDFDDNNTRITNVPPQIHYYDGDRDGFGAKTPTRRQSFATGDYVRNNNDCDDTDASIKPDNEWFQDADGDGTGGNISQQACYQPTGYVSSTGDACDNNSSTLVELTWYQDADGDGVGGNITQQACSQPMGYVANNGDACDNDPNTTVMYTWFLDGDKDSFGGSSFVRSCSDPSDSTNTYVKNTLDRDDTNPCITDKTPLTYYEDKDGDGYGNPSMSQLCSAPPHTATASWVIDNTDCNDNSRQVYPGKVWYRDTDGDGYGGSSPTKVQCTQPSGYVANQADYDDSTALITNIAPQTFYHDGDGDGYGTSSSSRYQSHRPSGYVTNKNDCDDSDPLQHNFTQWYIDQDGDGKGFNPTLLGITNSLRASPTQNLPTTGLVTTTQGCLSTTGSYVLNSDDYDDLDPLISEVIPQTFYRDADGDGYGTASVTIFQSTSTLGYVTNDDDCDDTNALLHPNTVWYLDSDGDGWGSNTSLIQCQAPTGYVSNTLDHDDTTEHITNIAPQTYYRDADTDGYGTPLDTRFYSYQPAGYVTNDQDCNDSDDKINPLTVWYLDSDGDGFGTKSSVATATTQQCTSPLGYVLSNDDYDDTTPNIINIAPQNFYQDADGDGYGNPDIFLYYSLRPTGYVTNNLDCNDQDKFVNPQKIWFQDTDGDGLGNPHVTTTSCTTPTGYVNNNGDLSDTSQYITNIATRTFYYDNDGDGFGDPTNTGDYSFAPPGYTIDKSDCNDNDNSIHPNTLWYQDSDGDGFGGPTSFVGCVPPSGYVRNNSDLDDSNRYITNIPGTNFYRDKDQDGYGDPNDRFFASYLPSGHVINNSDCNDNDASLHPKTQWYADNDNDGYGGAADFVGCAPPGNQVRQSDDYDDSTPHITNIPPRHFYQDNDGDSYGNPNESLYYSLQPAGYVDNQEDCNDNDASIHPQTVWYADSDGDSYGNPEVRQQQCEQPAGHVGNPWDLDDSNQYITNIAPVNFYRDADQDGFGSPLDVLHYSVLPPGYVVEGGDCDDNNPLLHPNTHWYQDQDGDGFGSDLLVQACLAPSGFVSNTLDLDDSTELITDQATRVFYLDQDGDGFGANTPAFSFSFPPSNYVITPGDCDDQNAYVHARTLWYFDGDGDGFGLDDVTLEQCTQPEGYALLGGDCDDEDPNKIPGASCVDIDVPDPEGEFEADQNVTGMVYADRDLDGFGDPEEVFFLSEVENILVAWVNDDEDACPEEYGEIKGCPEPIPLKSPAAKRHQHKLLLELTETASDTEAAQEALAQISDAQLAQVQSYPNPTDGIFTVLWDIPMQDFIGQLEIYSYPQLILIEDFPLVQQPSSVQIDLSNYPRGIYFLQFHFIDGRALSRKIVKQ